MLMHSLADLGVLLCVHVMGMHTSVAGDCNIKSKFISCKTSMK